MEAIKKNIVEAVNLAGGPVATAVKVGAPSYQAVQQWIAAGNVPSKYCVKLEGVSGISRMLLNRDAAEHWPELAEKAAA